MGRESESRPSPYSHTMEKWVWGDWLTIGAWGIGSAQPTQPTQPLRSFFTPEQQHQHRTRRGSINVKGRLIKETCPAPIKLRAPEITPAKKPTRLIPGSKSIYKQVTMMKSVYIIPHKTALISPTSLSCGTRNGYTSVKRWNGLCSSL